MARKPRTGEFEIAIVDGVTTYRGRLILQDGTRNKRFDFPSHMSEKAARDELERLQVDEDKTHAVYKAKLERLRLEAAGRGEKHDGETCNAWFDRFCKYRRDEVASVDKDRSRWKHYIAPHIGPKPIAEVSADDIENIRDEIKRQVLAYRAADNMRGPDRMAPKSGQNIWCVLTTAFKYAAGRHGPRELRVPELQGKGKNPCADIPPPPVGPSKLRHWIYPSELAAALASPKNALEWKEAIAIGVYLHLRPGELHELRVRDLDLDAGEVHITRSWDEDKKEVKQTKSAAGIRHVTIPATLKPLLECIKRDRGPHDHVAPIVASTPEDEHADTFRAFLKNGGACRAAIFVDVSTHERIDFRSIRDTGITWRFLAGDRAEVVQREAGHKDLKTTLGYAKEVSDRRGRFGEPFPTLPTDLAAAPAARPISPSPQTGPQVRSTPERNRRFRGGEGGIRNQEKPGVDVLLDTSEPVTAKTVRDAHPTSRTSGTVPGTFPQVVPQHEQSASDPIATALEVASRAGQWAIVAQLARELEARRLATEPNVVDLASRRTKQRGD